MSETLTAKPEFTESNGTSRAEIVPPTMPPFKLIDERLLVVVAHREEKKGLLYLPDSRKEKSTFGMVIAVGTSPIRTYESRTPIGQLFSDGDIVMFNEYSGIPVEWNDVAMSILSRSDVLCIVTDEEALTEIRKRIPQWSKQ